MVRRGTDAHTLRIEHGRELPMAAFRVPIDYGSWQPEQNSGPPLRVLLLAPTGKAARRLASSVESGRNLLPLSGAVKSS